MNLWPFPLNLLEEKALVTSRFLKQKLREYEEIKAEIEELRKETSE